VLLIVEEHFYVHSMSRQMPAITLHLDLANNANEEKANSPEPFWRDKNHHKVENKMHHITVNATQLPHESASWQFLNSWLHFCG
jgi:hypothetical protein